MTNQELATAIYTDLSDRTQWETRQAMFYEMRHHGLRRRHRMAWQSDVHFPLCSQVIEKLKPLYFQQIYASEQIAAFVPRPVEHARSELCGAAASWFDYQVKQRSDMEREILRAIDTLCVGGRAVLKVTWNSEKKRLRIQSRPITSIIVSSWTEDIETADRIVDVQTYSVAGYQRLPGHYRKDAETLKKITGTGEEDETGDSELRNARQIREGITHSSAGRIIVWEVWTRNGNGWECRTFSPLAPDIELRPKFRNPYNHGNAPFVTIAYEEKEAGWYSPRGLVETLAVFEAECTKILNEKNDAMTLYNRPTFQTTKDIPNTANLQMKPGQILPNGVVPVQMPSPPISFDQQLVLMRDIGQQLAGVPDFGTSDYRNTSDSKSATEIQAIMATSQQSSDLRMRIFRIGLGKLYRMSWATLLQFSSSDVKIVVENETQDIPKEALQDVYEIAPSGSADGINKQLLYAKATTRYQQFQQNPFIDQGELTKSVLEADDVGLVKRLYRDPGIAAANAREEQGQEIAVMRLGIPATTSASDDHAEHLRTIVGYISMSNSTMQPPTPAEMLLLQKHAAEHMEFLRKINPQAAKQAEAAIRSLSEIINEPTQGNQAGAPAMAAGPQSQAMAAGGAMGGV